MLIDSEKLKQAILSIMPERSEVLLIVDNQPEGIVRCKDCKWGEPAMNGKGEEMVFCYCGDTGIEAGWLLNPDWYCAEGEEPKDD